MTYTGIKNNEYVRNWRDKKLINGLCTRCGRNPLFKDKTKCKQCLLIAAEDQSQYRERIKRKKTSWRIQSKLS